MSTVTMVITLGVGLPHATASILVISTTTMIAWIPSLRMTNVIQVNIMIIIMKFSGGEAGAEVSNMYRGALRKSMYD